MAQFIKPIEHLYKFDKFIVRKGKDGFNKRYDTYQEALDNFPIEDGNVLEGFSEEFGLHSIHYVHNKKIKDYMFLQSL